jgi:hypothetical protein
MNTKLTLSIDKDVIKRAKDFAKNSNRSLSEIIESYLDRITNTVNEDTDTELERIKGIISLPGDFDEKTMIRNILNEKHLK